MHPSHLTAAAHVSLPPRLHLTKTLPLPPADGYNSLCRTKPTCPRFANARFKRICRSMFEIPSHSPVYMLGLSAVLITIDVLRILPLSVISVGIFVR